MESIKHDNKIDGKKYIQFPITQWNSSNAIYLNVLHDMSRSINYKGDLSSMVWLCIFYMSYIYIKWYQKVKRSQSIINDSNSNWEKTP